MASGIEWVRRGGHWTGYRRTGTDGGRRHGRLVQVASIQQHRGRPDASRRLGVHFRASVVVRGDAATGAWRDSGRLASLAAAKRWAAAELAAASTSAGASVQ